MGWILWEAPDGAKHGHLRPKFPAILPQVMPADIESTTENEHVFEEMCAFPSPRFPVSMATVHHIKVLPRREKYTCKNTVSAHRIDNHAQAYFDSRRGQPTEGTSLSSSRSRDLLPINCVCRRRVWSSCRFQSPLPCATHTCYFALPPVHFQCTTQS